MCHQNWFWSSTKSILAHTLSIEYKQLIDNLLTSWSTKYGVMLWIMLCVQFVFTATCTTCIGLTVRINCWWEEMVHELFCNERIMKYMLFHTTPNNWQTHFQQYHPFPITISVGIEWHWCRSCTIISQPGLTPWEMKLLFESLFLHTNGLYCRCWFY